MGCEHVFRVVTSHTVTARDFIAGEHTRTMETLVCKKCNTETHRLTVKGMDKTCQTTPVLSEESLQRHDLSDYVESRW